MKTQGELEASICQGMTHFEQEYMGRGPKDVRAHLIGDFLVVRLQGVLTAAEQQLVKSVSPDKDCDYTAMTCNWPALVRRPWNGTFWHMRSLTHSLQF